MYAKLYSSITESSLMEESIEVRYVFLALLAIADREGHVIGTEVALARRINVPLDGFRQAIARLSLPDPDSNSPGEEGRRLVKSDRGRGYRFVNYLFYRSIRDEAHRREYQRNYMTDYRAKGKDKSRPVNNGKHGLANAKAEAEAEAEADVEQSGTSAPTQTQLISAPSAAVAAPASTDEEWLNGLKSDPAYGGIDVEREHAKLVRWCQENRKQPTRRRFVNWLNRCDRPFAGPSKDQTHSATLPRFETGNIDPSQI